MQSKNVRVKINMPLKLTEISLANSKYAQNALLKDIEAIQLCQFKNSFICDKFRKYVTHSFQKQFKM